MSKISDRRCVSMVIAVAVAVLVSGPARASENLFFNAGFENGHADEVVGWRRQTFGTPGARLEVVDDPAAAHSGRKCVRLDPGGGYTTLQQGYGAEWDPSVYPGKRQKYLIQVQARGTNCMLLMHLAVYFGTERGAASNLYDEGQVYHVTDYKRETRFTVTNDAWQTYTASFIVPERVTHLIAMIGTGPGSRGPLWIDDVRLHDSREAQMRFLPSREELVSVVDPAFARHEKQLEGKALAARLEIMAGGRTVLSGAAALQDGRNTVRLSTTGLPEGDYTCRTTLLHDGQLIGHEDDWFEKRVFDWMRHPRGQGDDVPRPYTALETDDREVRPWGRRYRFDRFGMLDRIDSQEQPWLLGGMALNGVVGGRPTKWAPAKPFAFTDAQPGRVRGRATFTGDGLAVTLEPLIEYDGLITYRATLAPVQGTVAVDRVWLTAPLDGNRCRFFSSDGHEPHWNPKARDREPGYAYDLLPDRQGKVFDSLDRPQRGGLSRSFTGLFWLGDHDTCFCYAADNDQGWLLRDDAPSLEAVREGRQLTLRLNLIDRPLVLTSPRTLEFAFQAGPTKPLPEGWRGIQNGGDTNDAPLTFSLMQHAGSGFTLHGATHFIHPGTTPEQHRKSRERVEQALAGGGKAFGGYHFWGRVPKGFVETRVFRGEWGIDKYKWAGTTTPRGWEWKNRFFGDDPDRCVLFKVNVVPSYVDFCTYAYDEALRETQLTGFYDDVGYPKQLYDPELGIGYIRDDGAPIASSGQWIYRDRWQRAAYLNHRHNRPNFLWDSQHVHAHYLPVYNFIGVWAPCERGYYNSLADFGKDNLDFYGSMERYAAFNPSRQFGQIPMIGLSAGFRKTNAVVFAQHTRTMMMLTFLNDQDVGSFGARDERVVRGLRRARNRFKPWLPKTRFAGYWQNRPMLDCAPTNMLASLYHRPGEALLMIGNTGDADGTAVLEPSWRRLQLNPRQAVPIDAETGAPLEWDRTWTGRRRLRVAVPRHDLRLVLIRKPGR